MQKVQISNVSSEMESNDLRCQPGRPSALQFDPACGMRPGSPQTYSRHPPRHSRWCSWMAPMSSQKHCTDDVTICYNLREARSDTESVGRNEANVRRGARTRSGRVLQRRLDERAALAVEPAVS